MVKLILLVALMSLATQAFACTPPSSDQHWWHSTLNEWITGTFSNGCFILSSSGPGRFNGWTLCIMNDAANSVKAYTSNNTSVTPINTGNAQYGDNCTFSGIVWSSVGTQLLWQVPSSLAGEYYHSALDMKLTLVDEPGRPGVASAMIFGAKYLYVLAAGTSQVTTFSSAPDYTGVRTAGGDIILSVCTLVKITGTQLPQMWHTIMDSLITFAPTGGANLVASFDNGIKCNSVVVSANNGVTACGDATGAYHPGYGVAWGSNADKPVWQQPTKLPSSVLGGGYCWCDPDDTSNNLYYQFSLNYPRDNVYFLTLGDEFPVMKAVVYVDPNDHRHHITTSLNGVPVYNAGMFGSAEVPLSFNYLTYNNTDLLKCDDIDAFCAPRR